MMCADQCKRGAMHHFRSAVLRSWYALLYALSSLPWWLWTLLLIGRGPDIETAWGAVVTTEGQLLPYINGMGAFVPLSTASLNWPSPDSDNSSSLLLFPPRDDKPLSEVLALICFFLSLGHIFVNCPFINLSSVTLFDCAICFLWWFWLIQYAVSAKCEVCL